PTDVARSLMFDESLRSGEDLVYWFDVASRLRFQLAVSDADATYFRAHRTGTVSRQDPSYDFLVRQRLDVIERLAQRELPPNSIHVAGFRAALVAGQSAQIADFLREHPDEREAALAEI